jgi:hypothetical protein
MIADALEGKIIPHSVAQTPEMLRSPSLLSPLEQAPDPEIFGKGLPTNKIVGTEHVLSSEGLKAPFTSDELKAIINNDHGVATASKLDYASTGGTWKDLSPDATTQQITERNLEMAFARSRPTTIQNALADPAFRTPYDTSFAGNVSGTLKHPEMYGAREFTSFGDAWQSGGSLLERGGNIFQHATGTSVGELTDGAYTGFGSTRSAAGTAFTGAQYALAATADAPEEPVAPNYMARSMAKYELEKADPFTGPIDAQALTSQVDWSAPSNIYMNQMQNVINATGAPYLYGPTDFNFGHPRYQGAGGSFGGGGATGDY